MFVLMVVIFVLGYTAIALEHPLKVDKAASALIIGSLCWVAYILGGESIIHLGFSPAWSTFLAENPDAHGLHAIHEFIVEYEIIRHLGEISEILFFLMGAMTIVEMVDQHEGFKIITDKIKTTNKVKLLWILSFLTFFMSALLDNLTTTIVLVALLRKLIDDKQTRWFFASMVVLAANAGGAWSPIGDVTTIMLWIGGQITAAKIIMGVFIPSLLCMVVPLGILSFTMKGNVTRPIIDEEEENYVSKQEGILFLILGVGGLLFVPVFKTLTHLPPYMGMLLALGVLWVVSEIVHKDKPKEVKNKLKVTAILRRVDVPTVLFFLGILSAVAALQSAGHLSILSKFLDDKLGNIFLIDLAIGVLSSVVDNVPLVAGAMGMYPVHEIGVTGYDAFFVQDGAFWEFLAYTAGTGGSMLIIGSAAGVAAMGLEKIDFIWYLKKISWLALVGYLAGAAFYYIEFGL
ncbi:sodium:proton antiporter NhaD [Maribellus sp. YY47]|uniref:sodium:proton antiporter NhaD n=1 Tax=Maribellus sp. YY47 TaxID=2929486 RepID=UPI0020009759|nr:sodium:proton antiporter NhaD [Maribellus sp. YY47]MCK3684963.1 sodium:proton antiporter NhaD [Maribellus sp. YY47]